MSFDRFLAFVIERENIRLRRAAGGPPPWTDDPILAKYRFCNVYREHDTVTTWLRENWREPHADDPDLWHAILVARHLNMIDVLRDLKGPVLPWDPDYVREVLMRRKREGKKNFSGAYMIHCREPGEKIDYLNKYMFTPMWNQRETLRPRAGDTLNSWHIILGQLFGMGSFIAAQVIADCKYVEPLLSASDWHTFAASGPGSRRGMNWVLERPRDASWREDDWRMELTRIREQLLPHFAERDWEPICSQSTQSCLCEADKYFRTVAGVGKPKQIFRSGNTKGLYMASAAS